MKKSSDLVGKVAVVTAAGSGIGRAGAEAIASSGALVIVCDLVGSRAEETARRIHLEGGSAEFQTLDVGDDQSLGDLIAKTASQHGKIDILHSHAGVQIEGGIEDLDADGMDASYKLNLRSHFVAVKNVVPYMKDQGGAILLTSSNAGVFPDYGMIGYITTKSAVIMMAEQLALDLAKYSIRVNALCPGWIDTPFNSAYERQLGGREALEDVVARRVPLGRFGSVGEIADAILFLVSERSSYITGHALVIDGGERLVGAGPLK